VPRAFRPPKQALNPPAFSVSAAESWALDRSRKEAAALFRLTALWYVNFIRQPVPSERKTRYTLRVAQSQNYGISAGLTSALRAPDAGLVGLDTRRILKDGLCRDYIERTALVDLVAGHVSRPPDRTIGLNDCSVVKYAARARIFAAEADHILRRRGRQHLKGGRPHVLVIGATGGIVGALIKRGFRVSATDLWREAVGKELGGVIIQSGKTANARLMMEADLAIITGMTLPNRTLPRLMELAKRSNTSTMIWAITGKNLGHYYTEHGVDSVIADPSPFLLLPFPMTMAIWRRTT
jgi:hypothetical protein